MDEWRAIQGFDGYEVSSDGRVRSYRVRGQNKIAQDVQRILSPGWHRGYASYCLRRNGRSYQRRAHTLVAAAFLGECPEGLEVCHNDGDRANNDVQNLRYDTHASNAQDMRKHRTAGILSPLQVVQVRLARARGKSCAALAQEFGVTTGMISRLCTGQGAAHLAGPRTSHNGRKLNFEKAAEIRELKRNGYSLAQIAARYGIDKSMVSLVCNGKRWRAA